MVAFPRGDYSPELGFAQPPATAIGRPQPPQRRMPQWQILTLMPGARSGYLPLPAPREGGAGISALSGSLVCAPFFPKNREGCFWE